MGGVGEILPEDVITFCAPNVSAVLAATLTAVDDCAVDSSDHCAIHSNYNNKINNNNTHLNDSGNKTTGHRDSNNSTTADMSDAGADSEQESDRDGDGGREQRHNSNSSDIATTKLRCNDCERLRLHAIVAKHYSWHSVAQRTAVVYNNIMFDNNDTDHNVYSRNNSTDGCSNSIGSFRHFARRLLALTALRVRLYFKSSGPVAGPLFAGAAAFAAAVVLLLEVIWPQSEIELVPDQEDQSKGVLSRLEKWEDWTIDTTLSAVSQAGSLQSQAQAQSIVTVDAGEEDVLLGLRLN